MGADTKANTRELVRSQAAYSSESSVELPLRPSARAAPPSGPRSFCRRLRAHGNGCGSCEWCQWALTEKQTLRGRGALEAFDLRLREDFHELEQA